MPNINAKPIPKGYIRWSEAVNRLKRKGLINTDNDLRSIINGSDIHSNFHRVNNNPLGNFEEDYVNEQTIREIEGISIPDQSSQSVTAMLDKLLNE